MLRVSVCALVALFFVAGVTLAEEVKVTGTIKKVDAEKGTIVVTDKDKKDHTVKVEKATKLLAFDGKDLADGIKSKSLIEGTEVTVTCEKTGDKIACKEIKISKK